MISFSILEIGSRSEGSGVDAKLIGGIIGAILILLVVIIVIVWCRRKKNARKME
jgi:TRAP-type C4-dicarboxylate transport system permease large subunit